jgi:phosphatidate cytidylyltransferase
MPTDTLNPPAPTRTPVVTRTIIGTALAVLVAALFACDALFESRGAISGFIVALGLAGWCELAVLSRAASPSRGGGWAFFLVGFVGTAYFLALAWRQPSGPGEALPLGIGLGALLFFLFVAAVFRQDPRSAFEPVLITLLGVLLFGFLFSYLLRVYQLPRGGLLAAIFLVAVKGNDIAAYFTGRSLGRLRFLKVSPKKTLEGCAAGLAFSALTLGMAAWLWPELFASGGGTTFPWPLAVLLGIILGFTSQVGDLSESLIKRFYQVKDSSRLFPEMGGVLDLVDSALFSGFFFWILVAIGKP